MNRWLDPILHYYLKLVRTSSAILGKDVSRVTRIVFGTRPTPAPQPLNIFNGICAVNMKQYRTKTKDRTSSQLSNDLNMTNGLTPTDVSDTDSTSSAGDRKLMNRSALICSSGKDKYTYDSERADVPVRSVDYDMETSSAYTSGQWASGGRSVSEISSLTASDGGDRSSLPSDGDLSPVVKRDSVVQRFDVQRSLCVNGKYQNPWPTWRPPTFTNILKFGLARDRSNIPTKQDLDLALPIVRPNFTDVSPFDGLRITWLGHSTVLVQFDDICVLTDPIFSERASPSQMVGPKRYREAPCSVHDLPHNLDAVVISHSHYDHLDLNTVVMLNARFGSDLRWFVPLGLAEWMGGIGCENVVELDWWEENCVPDKSDVSFVFTPAQHWSKRTITDDNKVLWGSWAIIGPKNRFFFGGDTGYCDVFKQIGQIYGPFNAAAIPIGAYEPRWFMKYQHVQPSEAVQIHLDISSKFSLAIHWGTFALANEYYLDPPLKLREALERARLEANCFATFLHGETRLVTSSGRVERTGTTRRTRVT